MTAQRKILCTGANGFIGTNYIHYLYSTNPNVEIFNIDCLDFPITANNHSQLDPERYHFINSNIMDRDFIANLFAKEKFDEVVNFAANSHVDNSITNPQAFTANNILGTQSLLDAARDNDVKLFLHISTDEVYGSLENGAPSTTEESNLEPNNPYSASKAGADCLVRSYNKTFGLATKITRSSNNFGPYQYPEKFIPVILSNALNDQQIPVYGNGMNIRDWIFVEENCRAVDFVRQNGEIGEIYNIPGHKEIANIDICKTILKILDKPESLITFVEDRKGHDFRYSMDGSKLNNLGFKFESSFEENLEKTINWYKENSDWLMVKKVEASK